MDTAYTYVFGDSGGTIKKNDVELSVHEIIWELRELEAQVRKEQSKCSKGS